MYYTTSGAYRKTKIVIDYTCIVLTVCIAVMFVALLILQEKCAWLFPLIFAVGAVNDALFAVKKYMNYDKTKGIIMTVVAVVFLMMAAFTFAIVM